MPKARLVITAVTAEGLSPGEAARRYGVCQGWVSKLMARYRPEGEAASEPRSRRPKTSPNATAPGTVEPILALRKDLSGQGLDAEKRQAGPPPDPGQCRTLPADPEELAPRPARPAPHW
jgi:Helix-turn-helix domain